MTENIPEDELEPGDYDLDPEVEFDMVTPATEALGYPDVVIQDDLAAVQRLGFVNVFGRSPAEAIAAARNWVLTRRWAGVGQCLKTVRQYYNVPSKYGTATQSWFEADHKHFSSDGRDAPRGAPVWWTGGSSGAGHIAISCGGGVCMSTDWKEAGKVNYAHINDITSHWNLNYKGHTREVNDVVVWQPSPPKTTVSLNNLKPDKRNKDVLQLKSRLHEKGYKGFLVKSNKFGKGTRSAYARYQSRLGFDGKAANGIPGVTSLKKLGFKVIP